MPSEKTPVGIGIVGPADSVQFAWEWFSLHPDFVCVAVHATDDPPRAASNRYAHLARRTLREVADDPAASLIYFSGPISADLVQTAIDAEKHLVLEPPIQIGSIELKLLAERAGNRCIAAVLHQPRHWSEDFVAAKSVIQNGDIGPLERVRLSVHDYTIPREVFAHGLLRDIGFHYFDQLLLLVDEQPKSVSLTRFGNSTNSGEDGFLAVVDFDRGTSAMIEVQTRSLLSMHTGWMLEGRNGAYRGGRLYTKTEDDEIVDEPVARPNLSADPFLDVLIAALPKNTNATVALPDLNHAVRVMELIEMLERCGRP